MLWIVGIIPPGIIIAFHQCSSKHFQSSCVFDMTWYVNSQVSQQIPLTALILFCLPPYGNEKIKLGGLRFAIMGFQDVIVIVQVLFQIVEHVFRASVSGVFIFVTALYPIKQPFPFLKIPHGDHVRGIGATGKVLLFQGRRHLHAIRFRPSGWGG